MFSLKQFFRNFFTDVDEFRLERLEEFEEEADNALTEETDSAGLRQAETLGEMCRSSRRQIVLHRKELDDLHHQRTH